MRKRHVTTLFEHDVEVQVGGQSLVQVDGSVVERNTLGSQIVGPDDGGVASRSATPDVGLLENGDIGDVVVLGQIVRRCQSVNSSADDHDIVRIFEIVLTPDAWPIAPGDAFSEEAHSGELSSRGSPTHVISSVS